MSLYGRPFVDVLGAAVRAERLVLLYHVEEHAGMARPKRRAGQRAMQRQVLFGHIDLAQLVGGGHFTALPFATGVSQWRCLLSLPVTTSKKAFCMAFVIGPALPSPMVRPSSSRIGVTSAAVPVKKHSPAM